MKRKWIAALIIIWNELLIYKQKDRKTRQTNTQSDRELVGTMEDNGCGLGWTQN